MWLFFWEKSFSLETKTAAEQGRKKQSAEAKHSMDKNNVRESQEWNLLLSSLSPFFSPMASVTDRF